MSVINSRTTTRPQNASRRYDGKEYAEDYRISALADGPYEERQMWAQFELEEVLEVFRDKMYHRHYEAAYLYYIKGLNMREVANALGRPHSAIVRAIDSTRRTLKRHSKELLHAA